MLTCGLLACVCANMRVRLWLYVCVGACMCVYICVHAEVCTCMRVCERVCTCVNARAMHGPFCTNACCCVCIFAHRFVQRCVNADVRVCGGGCMHICVKSVCVVPVPASSPPWKPPVGLACTANQTLELLVLLLLNPLLSNHRLLLDHHGFTTTRDTAIPQNNC